MSLLAPLKAKLSKFIQAGPLQTNIEHSLAAMKKSALCLNGNKCDETNGDELENFDDGVVPIMFSACDGIAFWMENNIDIFKWKLTKEFMHEIC